MARQRVLWDAIDSDRRRWVRASFVVLPFVVLTALSVWVLVVTGSPRAIEFVIRAVAPITAIVLFPVLRGWRTQSIYQQIGAIPVATGMAQTTKSALADVSLAAGLGFPPQLYLYSGDAYNAFVWRTAGKLRIAVSSAYSTLPEDEQRAGLAMLVGRNKVDITAFAAEHEIGYASKDKKPPPENDPVLFHAWVDAALAGDREGLELLREPVPMICLLERLSMSPTAVPGFARDATSHDASFNFLAWPYPSLWQGAGVSAPGGLPARAEAAVQAVIAEEMAEGSLFGGEASGLGNAEALRAQRLREVSGAEGAIAGSTSAASRAAAAVSARAAAVAGAEASSPPPPHPAPPAAAPSPLLMPAAAAPVAPVAPTPTTPLAAPSVAASLGVTHAGPATSAVPLAAAAPPAHAVHIEVRCPTCGADNAPGNRECIRCGESMPQRV